MQDIRNIRLSVIGREHLDNPNVFSKLSERARTNDKIMFNKQKDIKAKKAFKEINRAAKLKPFGDADKDGIPNIVDRRPFKKDAINKIWRMTR